MACDVSPVAMFYASLQRSVIIQKTMIRAGLSILKQASDGQCSDLCDPGRFKSTPSTLHGVYMHCIHYTQYILHTLYTERFKSTPSTLQGVCILYPIHETTVKKKKSRILCIKFIHCEKRKSQILLIIRIEFLK